MKRILAIALFIGSASPLICSAQDVTLDSANPGAGLVAPQPPLRPAFQNPPPRPGMNRRNWLPQPGQEYDTPAAAVRRKAEQRSAQRRARLASQKWYGYSPLRPASSPMPFMGTYSTWPESAGYHAGASSYWFPSGRPWVIYR